MPQPENRALAHLSQHPARATLLPNEAFFPRLHQVLRGGGRRDCVPLGERAELRADVQHQLALLLKQARRLAHLQELQIGGGKIARLVGQRAVAAVGVAQVNALDQQAHQQIHRPALLEEGEKHPGRDRRHHPVGELLPRQRNKVEGRALIGLQRQPQRAAQGKRALRAAGAAGEAALEIHRSRHRPHLHPVRRLVVRQPRQVLQHQLVIALRVSPAVTPHRPAVCRRAAGAKTNQRGGSQEQAGRMNGGKKRCWRLHSEFLCYS